ncbi:hypothetical protein ATY81_01625 [Rhizobium sp. R72]|nr:hypothetical protein ATY81_01625 [Rhizobium sp. R72]OWW05761.1 hypothetical protein ATY80_01625 [Rhizobium sp. R711]
MEIQQCYYATEEVDFVLMIIVANMAEVPWCGLRAGLDVYIRSPDHSQWRKVAVNDASENCGQPRASSKTLPGKAAVASIVSYSQPA